LKTYPVANFSLHLLIPEDLDRLCQSLRKQNLPVPPIFRGLLVDQVWYDGISESLTVVAESFALAVAGLCDATLEHIALDWSAAFHYQEPLHQTPAYQALMRLRTVAQDAIAQKKALLLHLVG